MASSSGGEDGPDVALDTVVVSSIFVTWKRTSHLAVLSASRKGVKSQRSSRCDWRYGGREQTLAAVLQVLDTTSPIRPMACESELNERPMCKRQLEAPSN
jgi:hypothetical protein